MLSYNEITTKSFVEIDGEPFEVLSSHVFRKQQRKPVNQTKLRSLKTGRVTERTFHQSESVQEAELEKQNIKYLYSNRGESWFFNPQNPRDRFTLPGEIVKNKLQYLKENDAVTALVFHDEIVHIALPIKIEAAVVETSPNVRGNTAQGGTKPAVLETGATVTVPMFINVGDIVRVNTNTGEYVERVEKK